MKSFKDKVAIVTGAAGGMGKQLVLELAKSGAHVAFCDIIDMSSTVEELKQYDVKAYSENVDMGNKESINTFLANVLEYHGHVDILINNAGIALGDRTFEEVTEADMEKITNINYWGVIHTTQRLYKHLLSRPEAAILNVSSIQGILPLPYLVPYCSTKFAVRGFTDALRVEHQIRGIDHVTVHTVHPGAVATDITINADYHGVQTKKFHRALQRGLSANKAAKVMLKGILEGKTRILVSDARPMEILQRLIPSSVHHVIKYVMKKQKIVIR